MSVGSISHAIQVEGPSWLDICEHVQVTSRSLLILSLFVQCFSSGCAVSVWERFKREELAQIWWLLFASAWGASSFTCRYLYNTGTKYRVEPNVILLVTAPWLAGNDSVCT